MIMWTAIVCVMSGPRLPMSVWHKRDTTVHVCVALAGCHCPCLCAALLGVQALTQVERDWQRALAAAVGKPYAINASALEALPAALTAVEDAIDAAVWCVLHGTPTSPKSNPPPAQQCYRFHAH